MYVCMYIGVCVCVLLSNQFEICEYSYLLLPIGVVERLSCLEGKVDLHDTAIQDLQSGQDSLSQKMDRVETQSRGR